MRLQATSKAASKSHCGHTDHHPESIEFERKTPSCQLLDEENSTDANQTDPPNRYP